MIIKGKAHDLKISEPELYVNNEARNRSGHMGHAIINLGNGKIMDFNSNVSPVRFYGHSGFGWMEYRISEDYGESFGEINELPYSKQAFFDGVFTALVEKAVRCDNGRIIAFCMRCSQYNELCCCPYLTSTYVYSDDDGKSWGEAKPFSQFAGRIFDAVYRDGSVYVLEFCNDATKDFRGVDPDHLYRIFKSDDNGESFYELTVVPFPTTHMRSYGAMIFDLKGNLIVYAYNNDEETELDYIISGDCGKTWENYGRSHLAKRIRNPQIALLDDQYILHGREAGDANRFVMYTSADGLTWDEGYFLTERFPGTSFYSNNEVIRKDGKNRLLVQYSQVYKDCRVNIYHIWLENIKG